MQLTSEALTTMTCLKGTRPPTIMLMLFFAEEIPATSAFKKCRKSAEAKEKLSKLVLQAKRLNFETGYVVFSPVVLVSSS